MGEMMKTKRIRGMRNSVTDWLLVDYMVFSGERNSLERLQLARCCAVLAQRLIDSCSYTFDVDSGPSFVYVDVMGADVCCRCAVLREYPHFGLFELHEKLRNACLAAGLPGHVRLSEYDGLAGEFDR